MWGWNVDDVGRVCDGLGSVLFQYNGVEVSVCCQYIVSILEYLGRMLGGRREGGGMEC